MFFLLHPAFNIYDTTPFNKNFSYFNMKQKKTMPNGLGQGVKLDYFWILIDSEFGLVKTSPLQYFFHSPTRVQEGWIVELEVWGLDLSLTKRTWLAVLNMDPELQAAMEMMGKLFHSTREVDAKEEDEEKQQLEF